MGAGGGKGVKRGFCILSELKGQTNKPLFSLLDSEPFQTTKTFENLINAKVWAPPKPKTNEHLCFFCLFQVGGPVDVITCESKVACKFSVFFSVNRVFEKDFEGFRSWECRIRHRINLLYLLNLAEPQKVQILRGRHPKR